MWMNFINFLASRMDVRDEEGQTLVEYALIIALVSVALIGALGLLTGGITGAFNSAIDALT